MRSAPGQPPEILRTQQRIAASDGERQMSNEIAYCMIFPTIGIARVGNSKERDGFFIAPEGIEPPALSDERRFTDAARRGVAPSGAVPGLCV